MRGDSHAACRNPLCCLRASPERASRREEQRVKWLQSLALPPPSSVAGSSPARHRAVALGSSAEVFYHPHKPLHCFLLDADKLNPNLAGSSERERGRGGPKEPRSGPVVENDEQGSFYLDHLPRHLSPTPHKLLGLLSSQSVVTTLIQGNRLFKIVIGEF